MSTTYEEIVNSFEKIDSTEALELIKSDAEAVIYVGKEVCPYCQKFVVKLIKVAEETNTHIYHVNSVEESDLEGITAFRNEYNIPTVPGFIYTNGNTVNVKCDSSMSEEDIKAFINK
ncbi:thioredoxin domain-containing protein [Ureibacillus acetophenoni]|uniref:Predicted bacteriocin transport accessory protein n=1 Tax=Ureibacillus acetophenoni TaxID=614649 RepID=A0A285UG99_9BACL|nr:thiol reductase thioredoxin [Ureibacillus acetophenoni]SOC40910.1 predicted bacteriocin transport accessory protein [Ureibacillus acetophenoni]